MKIACSRLLTNSPGFLAPLEVSANKKKHPDKQKKRTCSHGQESEHSLHDKPWHNPLPPESLLLMVGWQLLHQKKPIGRSQCIFSAELDRASSHHGSPASTSRFVFWRRVYLKINLKIQKASGFRESNYNRRDIMFLLGQTLRHSRHSGRRLPKATKPPPPKQGRISIETRSSEFLQIFTHVQQSFTLQYIKPQLQRFFFRLHFQ